MFKKNQELIFTLSNTKWSTSIKRSVICDGYLRQSNGIQYYAYHDLQGKYGTTSSNHLSVE